MEHYYSNVPEAASAPQRIEYFVDGRIYEFITDRGVFSKNNVDFGSRLLVETALSERLSGNVLDLGCGYGAVGIPLFGRNPGIKLVMADINERAVDLCKKNVELNFGLTKSIESGSVESGSIKSESIESGSVESGSIKSESIKSESIESESIGSESIEVVQSDGLEGIDLCFGFIFLNPPIRAGKSVVFRLYNECRDRLNPGGRLYVVIQKKQGMESSLKELQRIFGNCGIAAKKSGYCVLCSNKFTSK